MKYKTVRGFTTKELTSRDDAVFNAPYKARAISCQSALKQIGRAVTTYKDKHGGKYPPDFQTL